MSPEVRSWWNLVRCAVPLRMVGLLVLVVSAGAVMRAQSNQWTWMGGSQYPTTCPDTLDCGNPGVYGTLGTPSQGNYPGSRSGASSWKDSGGRVWLFSGSGFDSTGTPGGLDDLWLFDPAIEIWTWMGGSETVPGMFQNETPVLGTLGVGSTANTPGYRHMANQWTDTLGNLWLWAGGTSSNANDLWKYDPSSGEWTWIGGSNSINTSTGLPGRYGTLGKPSQGSIPGARDGVYSCSDSSGRLWLFGGYGEDSVGNVGSLNDLWVFNPSTQEWTWVAGSSTVLPPGDVGITIGGPSPVYGTLGVPGAGNTPGGRYGGSCWIDSGGNIWLFGGDGQHLSGAIGNWNDLWEFNPITTEWTWMSGTDNCPANGYQNLCDNPGVYGTQGVAANGNVPGARLNSTPWTDNDGNLWLFGGMGFDSQGYYGYLNDLWEFSPVARQWTWQGGGNSITIQTCYTTIAFYCGNLGVYGTKGTPDAGNTPGGRDDASGWIDSNGNLWMFGGQGYGSGESFSDLNDLWMFAPATSALPVAAPPAFSPASGTYDSAQTVAIDDTTPGATIYFTIDGTPPTLNSQIYSGPLTVIGNEAVEAIAVANGYAVSAISAGAYLLPKDFKLGISQGTLILSPSSSGNVALTVTPYNGFSSAVTFACSGLPGGATCSFNPATVTPSGAAVTTMLSISVPAQTAAVGNKSRPFAPEILITLVLGMAGVRRRSKLQALLLFVVVIAGFGLASCGSGASSGSGSGGNPQPTVSAVTVTGISGTTQQSVNLMLTVN